MCVRVCGLYVKPIIGYIECFVPTPGTQFKSTNILYIHKHSAVYTYAETHKHVNQYHQVFFFVFGLENLHLTSVTNSNVARYTSTHTYIYMCVLLLSQSIVNIL